MSGSRTPTRYPGRIIVTPDRVPRELGNIRGLAKSIARDGLLQPIVVKPNGELVCGWRRLEAWRLLDRWDTPIPVHVVDIDAIARGDWAENTQREDRTWSELVQLVRALRPAFAAAARERQRVLGRRHGKPLEADPAAQIAPEGRTRDLIAKGLGISARTFDKAEAVVVAAEEDPAQFGRLRDEMDRTGKVNAQFRQLRVIRQANVIRAEPPPYPGRGPYRVIVTDFPWPYDTDGRDQSERAVAGYPLMTMAEIEAVPIGTLAHADCAWWCWCTNHVLLRGDLHRVMAHFGFRPVSILTWGKDRHGQGRTLLGQTEHCVLAVRGSPTIVAGAASTLLTAPRRGPSEKPREFYDLVERVTPAAAYCELYPHLQTPRLNWDRNYIGTPPAAEDEAVADEAPAPIAADESGPYRVPRGPAIADLLPKRTVVRTSYGTGPFVVVAVTGPHMDRATGRHQVWSLELARHVPHGRPTRRLYPEAWINDLVAVDGRILKLDRASMDEVLIDEPVAAGRAAA